MILLSKGFLLLGGRFVYQMHCVEYRYLTHLTAGSFDSAGTCSLSI